MLGGEDGLPHHYILRRANGQEIVLGTKTVGIRIEPGDRLIVHSGGGGGWGEPDKRRPEARALDLENGLVTAAGAAGK
jgi:N-methylhydantoinase B